MSNSFNPADLTIEQLKDVVAYCQQQYICKNPNNIKPVLNGSVPVDKMAALTVSQLQSGYKQCQTTSLPICNAK